MVSDAGRRKTLQEAIGDSRAALPWGRFEILAIRVLAVVVIGLSCVIVGNCKCVVLDQEGSGSSLLS